MDGILFFKEYLKDEKIVKSQNFKNVYFPELQELLNDEEADIRIEAVEIFAN